MAAWAEAPGDFEAVAVHEEGIGEDALRGAVGLKPAGVDHQDAGAEIEHEVQIVSGDQLQARKTAENALQLPPGTGIEGCGWLVQDKHGGLAGEEPRQADSFAFADAELGRIARAGVGQADGSQGLRHTAADFIEAEAGVERSEGDVVLDRGAEELVVGVLKQQSDLASNERKLGGDDWNSRDVNGRFAGAFWQGGGQQAIEVEQQGRFSCAAGADEGDPFALAETERHAIQG